MGNAKLRISAQIDLDLAPIKAFTSTGSLHGATSKHLKDHLGPYLSDVIDSLFVTKNYHFLIWDPLLVTKSVCLSQKSETLSEKTTRFTRPD